MLRSYAFDSDRMPFARLLVALAALLLLPAAGSAWAQETRINATDGAPFDRFGSSVSMSADGQQALVGARGDDRGGNLTGSAYVFAQLSNESWVQQAKLTATDGEETDRFGGSVAISADGQRGLIGAERDVVNGNLTQGSAYAYGPASLPVELASFTARASGERAAVLEWQTLTETMSDGFRIERRPVNGDVGATGRSPEWTRLAFVESKAEGGTSQEPLAYRFRAEGLDYGRHAFRLVQRDLGGTETPVGSEQAVEIGLADAYALSEAYPNPFRQSATVEVAVRSAQAVTASLYDALGRRVAVLHDGELPGHETHRLTVEAGDLASGVYFVRVVGEDFAASRKVVVVR